MKKLFYILIIILVLPTVVLANGHDNTYEYGTFDNAQIIVKEVLKDYYIRGPYMQYNYAKTIYGFVPPELATSQDTLHSVCAAYNYDVYTEAFGMDYYNGKFPRYNYEVTSEGSNYYTNHSNNLDGKFLIYYEKKGSNIKYVYGNSTNISDFAQVIQPGDVFTYTGHVMVAYDKVERSPGVWDVLMLESGTNGTVRTRIESTSKIFYNLFKSSYGINNYLDIEKEGNIKYFWLSSRNNFFKNGVLNCTMEECVVIRPYYNDNGKAVFNYKINEASYQKSMLRINYPGLFIEKTVDVGDKNSVYLGDRMTYTIKITNKSGVDYNPVTYNKFYIDENVDEKVEVISVNNNAIISGNRIKWTINSLGPNESVVLQYTVKVNDDIQNINKIIIPSGNFYANENESVIGTGVVENNIVPKLDKTIAKKSYNECYNLGISNNKTGLELIDYIYNCTYEKDFNFDELVFENMFNKKNITAKGAINAITFKSSNDSNISNYKKMILNNYWGGLVKYGETNTQIIDADDQDDENSNEPITVNYINYMLPSWSSTDKRAKEIKYQDFKDGDVLIYYIDYDNFNGNNEGTKDSLRHTKENGMYAYIYLNGEFVGNNYPNETENPGRTRNAFNYNYYYNNSITISTHLYALVSSLTDATLKAEVLKYANYQTLFDKDYYLILRPELAIKEVYGIEVTTLPSKLIYNQNRDCLDLTDGVVTITYNDGSTESTDLNNQNIQISGFDNTIIGNQVVIVKYDNQECEFNITVKKYDGVINAIEVLEVPNKIIYYKDSNTYNVIGGLLKITYNDGTNETIAMTNNDVQIITINNNQVILKYLGEEVTFESSNIEVLNNGNLDDDESLIENPNTGIFIPIITLLSLILVVILLKILYYKNKKLLKF